MAKKMLDVLRVGFYGNTGEGNRSPEDFCLPACMTSLTQFLGSNDPIYTTYDKQGRAYTKRSAYDAYLAATGIGFGLLFSPSLDMGSMDFTLANPHDETIRRAFRWAGYGEEILPKKAFSHEAIWEKIKASIDKDVPALAFGIIGPPECLIITGYDDADGALIGWSHFQQDSSVPTEPNGMFHVVNWYDPLWKAVIVGEKAGRSLMVDEIVRNGTTIMKQKESNGFLAGSAAYEAWISMILDSGNVDDETLNARYEYHRSMVGNLAEARAYCGGFLEEHGYAEAGECFKRIHDLCWKVWGVVGQAKWEGLREERNCGEIASLLRDIQTEEEKALSLLQ